MGPYFLWTFVYFRIGGTGRINEVWGLIDIYDSPNLNFDFPKVCCRRIEIHVVIWTTYWGGKVFRRVEMPNLWKILRRNWNRELLWAMFDSMNGSIHFWNLCWTHSIRPRAHQVSHILQHPLREALCWNTRLQSSYQINRNEPHWWLLHTFPASDGIQQETCFLFSSIWTSYSGKSSPSTLILAWNDRNFGMNDESIRKRKLAQTRVTRDAVLPSWHPNEYRNTSSQWYSLHLI